MLIFGNAKLVDGEELVPERRIEINDTHLLAAYGTLCIAIFHRYPIDKQPMQRAVADDEIKALGACELAVGIFQRVRRQGWVQAHQGVAEPAFQDNFAIIRALRPEHAGGNLGAVARLPDDAFKPGQRCLFDDGFGERSRHGSLLFRFPPRVCQISSAVTVSKACLIRSIALGE